MITHTFNTEKLLKDANDNIRVVEWRIDFTEGDHVSTSAGRTLVPEEVALKADGDIEAAVLQQHNENFIQDLMDLHKPMLEEMALMASLTEVTPE